MTVVVPSLSKDDEMSCQKHKTLEPKHQKINIFQYEGVGK